ncbi:MAG: hypothetical protein IJ165_12480 [Proteobacteria bacterium]|nr:hypothetical protein [Pseudomonadota bacterium]
MNYKRYLISALAMAAAAAGTAGHAPAAYADSLSASEGLSPIVFILLDTSGCMNELFETANDQVKNNTRLTKALGELVGTSKNLTTVNGKPHLVRAEDPNDLFYLPYAKWTCSGSTCSYQKALKAIKGQTELAKPNFSTSSSTSPSDSRYETAYNSDGIIQTYAKLIKFGFAGFGVGTTGSSAAKDSPIKLAAQSAGGNVEGVLRFTTIWGEDYQSTSDIDTHLWLYNYPTEYIDGQRVTNNHLYYANKCSVGSCIYKTVNGHSACTGVDGCLDVDNTYPYGNSYSVKLYPNQTKCPTYYGSSSYYYQPCEVGVENIAFVSTKYMKPGQTFNYQVYTWYVRNSEKGWRVEVAYPNDEGCTASTIYTYNPSSPIGSSGTYYDTATVTYQGNNHFTIAKKASVTSTVTEDDYGKPNYIYGYGTNRYSLTNENGITYGRDLTAYKYKKSDDCTFDMGMWSSNPLAAAPLVYPTVSDKEEMIEQSNNALITTVRSYQATSATPIGESLADLYFMFGGDDISKTDQGLIKQKMSGGQIANDDYYACRSKAVILISDGDPNGSGLHGTDDENENLHGHSKQVWWDAYHLFKAGIKVYVVGYAEFDDAALQKVTEENSVAATLNKTAWKGGTCRNPKTNEIINPNSESDYQAFINDNTLTYKEKICFYNAADNTALRAAVVNALSAMLQGVYSKTKVATTTAVGYKNNYKVKTENNKKQIEFRNGYYSLYSGYSVSLAPIRKSRLERQAIICDHESGEFFNDTEQYLDIAHRLKCRLSSCDVWRAATEDEALNSGGTMIAGMNYKFNDASTRKRAGFDTDPATCAPLSTLMDNAANVTNTCVDKRYIFAADYKAKGNRNAISTFPRSANELNKNFSTNATSFLTVDPINSTNFGTIPQYNSASNLNYFVTQAGSTCNTEMNRSITELYGKPNYILSPYECVNNMDCGMEGNDLRLCDLGRCISASQYKSRIDKLCTNNAGLSSDEICINGMRRKKYTNCTTHAQCGDGKVCHAGQCASGTVTSCDLRQFIASMPLGAIEYATPTPINPPTRAYRSYDYRKFSQKYWQRDTMLMAGANDGLLHAFILGDNTNPEALKNKVTTGAANDYTGTTSADGTTIYKITDMPGYKATIDASNKEGDELWAYMPKHMLIKASKLTEFGQQTMLNTAPVSAEVKLPGFTINNDSWRSVVVGGFRDGARGYYAIDVTDPGHPIVLWEIDPFFRADSTASNEDIRKVTDKTWTLQGAVSNFKTNIEKEPFYLMGMSYAQPVITNMLIGNQVEPVAILTGGESTAETNTDSDAIGKSLYIVRLFPKTPSDLLVKAFYFDNRITGTPAVYPNNFNSVAQNIYVGDNKGKLYRIVVSDSNTSKWGSVSKYTSNGMTIELPAFDPRQEFFGKPYTDTTSGYDFSKISFAPAVALYTETGAKPVIQLAFGTGTNDNFNVMNTDRHYFASFIDVPKSDGTYELNYNASTYQFMPTLIVLNSPENLQSQSGKITVYRNSVPYKNSNVALPARQKLTGAPIIHNFASYFPSFIADADSNTQCPTGGAAIWKILTSSSVTGKQRHNTLSTGIQANGMTTDPFANSPYIQFKSGTKIYGLEITNQMFCTGKNKNSVLAPQLVAQSGVETNDDFSTTSTKRSVRDDALSEVAAVAINLEAIEPQVNVYSWASVYE